MLWIWLIDPFRRHCYSFPLSSIKRIDLFIKLWVYSHFTLLSIEIACYGTGFASAGIYLFNCWETVRSRFTCLCYVFFYYFFIFYLFLFVNVRVVKKSLILRPADVFTHFFFLFFFQISVTNKQSMFRWKSKSKMALFP